MKLRHLLCFALTITTVGCADPAEDDASTEQGAQGPQEVCFGTTLSLRPRASNFDGSARRPYDNEPLCWTYTSERDEASDTVTFELTRTFAVGGERRYGCRFEGSGNSLRAEISEGYCLLEADNGHMRLDLVEPADIQLQDIHSTSATLAMVYEERRDWRLEKGEATFAIANQRSVLQGLDRGEEDLDGRGPSADAWQSCPATPVCVRTDLTGQGELVGETADDEVCQDWLSRLQYGELVIGVTEAYDLDWLAEGETIYSAVREADQCVVTGFSGSMDTRHEYLVDLSGEVPFRMELRGYHQLQTSGNRVETRFCEGVWEGPLSLVDCPN